MIERFSRNGLVRKRLNKLESVPSRGWTAHDHCCWLCRCGCPDSLLICDLGATIRTAPARSVPENDVTAEDSDFAG